MLRLQLIIEGKRGGCCREEGGTERLRRPHRDKLGTRGPSARSGGAEEAGAGRRGARWAPRRLRAGPVVSSWH